MSLETSEDVQNVEVIDEIEIELFGKENKTPPKARVYVLRIDKSTYRTREVLLTGKQLLELTQKQPIEQFKIFQKLHGGQRKEIKYEETVDLRTKGIERFQTVPLCETEG